MMLDGWGDASSLGENFGYEFGKLVGSLALLGRGGQGGPVATANRRSRPRTCRADRDVQGADGAMITAPADPSGGIRRRLTGGRRRPRQRAVAAARSSSCAAGVTLFSVLCGTA